MWILPLVGYLGLILGFVFLTLAIASGLYYLSELVEEHTVISKKLLVRLIFVVIAVQVLLLAVDRFPLWLTLLSVSSNLVYLQNLRRFPIIKLTDPIFLASCVLVLLNHWLWFRHFSAPPAYGAGSSRSYKKYTSSYYDSPYAEQPSFTEIASFFGLCVWLVPFALFVSLSASENVLPSMGSEYATGEGSSFVSAGKEPARNGFVPGRSRHGRSGSMNVGMAKATVDGVRGWVEQTVGMMGMQRKERRGFD